MWPSSHEGNSYQMADIPSTCAQDSMISHHEVLENGDGRHRCQVVRWIRSFPFSFLKERQYIIARRVWREDGVLYGITKCIEHPRAVYAANIVRMDSFYSMWRRCACSCLVVKSCGAWQVLTDTLSRSTDLQPVGEGTGLCHPVVSRHLQGCLPFAAFTQSSKSSTDCSFCCCYAPEVQT